MKNEATISLFPIEVITLLRRTKYKHKAMNGAKP